MNAKVELKTEERTRCEVWTRVMGYHRPVSEFNAGKQSEHAERRHFTETRSCAPQRAAA
ncbi:MAG: oxidoreductase [Gammaproteobacteria bacterium]|nr:oxidoreductase [Gammaproteobacteria bacterium]